MHSSWLYYERTFADLLKYVNNCICTSKREAKCYSALGLNAPLIWSYHHRPNKNMVYNCLIICDQLLETGVIYCNYTTDITSSGFSFVVQGHYPKVLSCATLSSVTDLHRLEILYNRKFVSNSQILQQKLLFLQVFSNSDFAALTFHSSRIK